jgi:hypothetical protein
MGSHFPSSLAEVEKRNRKEREREGKKKKEDGEDDDLKWDGKGQKGRALL